MIETTLVRYSNSGVDCYLTFRACGHQERYSFVSSSPLHAYLCTKKGWIHDSDNKYTINYILIVLFSIIKEKQLNCRQGQAHLYFCDDDLREALGVRVFHLNQIRCIVKEQLRHSEPLYIDKDQFPFWCPPLGLVGLIFELTSTVSSSCCSPILYSCPLTVIEPNK